MTSKATKFYPVFLEVSLEGKVLGRIIIELYEDTPRTGHNFSALCTGNNGKGKQGKPLHYKGNAFHRIEPNFLI